jgi:uncharacterized protein
MIPDPLNDFIPEIPGTPRPLREDTDTGASSEIIPLFVMIISVSWTANFRHADCEGAPLEIPLIRRSYNGRTMSLIDQIQKDLVAAMKAREEQRLSCLRMVKTALKLRETEKMGPLDDKESQQVLATLIKQRKDSVEQFTKGGRQEMADKEAAEIKMIEAYLPQAAGEEEIVAGVKATIAEMGSPTIKDMGTVMKNAMARFAAAGMRVEGRVVSETVKKELTGK